MATLESVRLFFRNSVAVMVNSIFLLKMNHVLFFFCSFLYAVILFAFESGRKFVAAFQVDSDKISELINAAIADRFVPVPNAS